MDPREQTDLFPSGGPQLPPPIVAALRRFNPWWEGRPGQVLPRTRRRLVGQMQRRMEQGAAPIVVVRGPRQIGKTTAQMHVIQDLLQAGFPSRRLFRVQFDDLVTIRRVEEPILLLADWYERAVLGQTLNEAAQEGASAVLFLDEIQNVPNWAPQLKSLVDSSSVRVVVTGSSALRIEAGRDSLAGRITSIEAGTLSLGEAASFRSLPFPEPLLADNGLEPLASKEFWQELRGLGIRHRKERDAAFAFFSERGSYPIAHEKKDLAWEHLAAQLNETVVRRVIKHDLRMGERGRKRDEALLEELFRLACRYAGQSPSPQLFSREAHRALGANVGVQRIRSYMSFLDGSLLVRLVPPLEIRLRKKKGAPRICLADHALRASWLQETVPLTPAGLRESPELSTLAGHIAESAAGAMLSRISGLSLAHFPERGDEPEVDFVMTLGVKRIPIEIKYHRRIDTMRDTEGLRAFIENRVYNAPFGLLIVQDDNAAVEDPRIVAMPLSTFLMLH